SAKERRSITQLVRSSLGLSSRFLSASETAQVANHGEVPCGLEPREACSRKHCATPLKGEITQDGRLFACPFGTSWYLLPIDQANRRLGFYLVGPFFEDAGSREKFFEANPALRDHRTDYPLLPSASRGALVLIRDWLLHRVRSIHMSQELAKKETLLLSLLDSTKIIHSTPNSEELLSYLTDISTYLTHATNGLILLLDETGQWLRIVVARGVMPDFDRDYRIRVGEGVTGWVAEHGEPLNIPDTESDERYIAVGYQAASELAVPIRRNDRVIGVLVVDSVEPRAFSAFDQQLLSSLAFQVSTVLDAVKLEAERSRKLEQLEVLHAVAAAAGESLEVEALIPRVLGEAASVFEATGAVLL
ncbi:MAG: transcriptional regulator, NifA subfamily, Fis Family, partial [Acidimicrobiaceae bacterium]